MTLAYNDIDIWYKSIDDEDEGREGILKVTYEKNVFPDRPDIELNVIRMGRLNLRGLIDDFDMNNVQVGYKVVPKIKGRKLVTEVAETYLAPAFHKFLLSSTLEIVDPTNKKTGAASLIRLLYKAQQLGLDYSLPPEKELLQAFSDRAFAPEKVHQKLQQLTGRFREEIFSRFNVVLDVCHNWSDCPYEGKQMYRLICKDTGFAGRHTLAQIRARDRQDAVPG